MPRYRAQLAIAGQIDIIADTPEKAAMLAKAVVDAGGILIAGEKMIAPVATIAILGQVVEQASIKDTAPNDGVHRLKVDSVVLNPKPSDV